MKKTLIMLTLSVSCLSLMAMDSDEGYQSDTENVARPERLYDVINPGHPNMSEERMSDFENRARSVARDEAEHAPRLTEASIQVLLFDGVQNIHRADGSTITLAELIESSRN